MATNTSFLSLSKPAYSDPADVAVINGNMDKIDAAVGQRSRVPDLVINGNFMPGYIVNQRGESSYPGAKYGVDMWKGTTSASTISVTSEGLAITHGGTSGYAMAMQRFPDHIYSAYKDSVVTIAACLSDGTVAAKSGIPSNGSFNASFSNGFSAQLYAPSGETYIGVRLMNSAAGSTVTVRWVSVYPGAFTADNLPGHQPKSYAETITECMQYVKVVTNDYLFGRCTSTTGYIDVPLSVPMAARPTITISAYGAVRVSGKSLDVTAIAVSGIRPSSIPITASYASTSDISNHICTLNNESFVLSCEPT